MKAPSSDYEPLPGGDDVEAQQAPVAKRPLTLLPLIAIIFFEVSGGPFGTEDAVAAGGPLLVILGFIIFPIIWSIPEAMITAELATAFPENSGYVAWVTAAFGPFWGFQEGFWSWLSGVTDNSIYPVMLADNLRLFFPSLNDGWPRTVFLLTMTLLLTYMNYRGLNVVGGTALSTTIFIIAPFLLLCGLAAPHVDPSNWTKVDWATVDWATFLNVMFWNLNYWDNVSTLAGEVANPSRNFPRALLWAVLLVVASYLLPTMAALGVLPQTGDWELGYYGKVAEQVGGNWLAWWVVAAAAASQIGQFQAEMSSDSYQLLGMAERGFLPKVLTRRSRHGTPVWGVLLSSVGVVTLASFSFVEIVALLNAIYCMAELLEFAAFVWLRVKAPALPRPYRVPLPTWGLVLMLLPASSLLVVVLMLPFFTGDWQMVAVTMTAMFAGFVLYPLFQMAKEHGWCEFTSLEFDFSHDTAGGHGCYTIHASGHLTYNDKDNYVDVQYDGCRRSTSGASDVLVMEVPGPEPGSGAAAAQEAGGAWMANPQQPQVVHACKDACGWQAVPRGCGVCGGCGGDAAVAHCPAADGDALSGSAAAPDASPTGSSGSSSVH